MAKTVRDTVYDIICSGNFKIKQKIGDGPIEDYCGCMGNLFSALSGDAFVEKVKENSELYQGTDTYVISFNGFMGDVKMIVWQE